MRVAVVIPAFNESATVGEVVREVRCAAPHATIVVVDDGSDDDTSARAQGAGAIVLRHIVNRGQGAALETGTRYAVDEGAEVIAHFDADGQHWAEDILRLVEPIMRGEAEVVFGSRFLSKTSKTDNHADLLPTSYFLLPSQLPFSKRHFLIPLARLVNRLVAGVWLSDAHCGLRALSRRAAEKIAITQDRMAHGSEIPAQVRGKGLRFIEVPVSVRYREYGQGVGGGFSILKDLTLGRFL